MLELIIKLNVYKHTGKIKVRIHFHQVALKPAIRILFHSIYIQISRSILFTIYSQEEKITTKSNDKLLHLTKNQMKIN